MVGLRDILRFSFCSSESNSISHHQPMMAECWPVRVKARTRFDGITLHATYLQYSPARYLPSPSRVFPFNCTDKKMEEPLKRRRSASLWNWFDKLRLDQQRRGVIGDKVKPDHPNRRVNADLNLNLSYLTLDESPVKRRWIPKRMTRPVSCYVLTGGDDGQQKKNRSFFETHFPSDPIPQRVRAAGSIQTLVSLNKPDDRQQVRTSA